MMSRLPATACLPFTPFRTAGCVLMLMLAIGLAEGDFALQDSYSEFHMIVALGIGYLCFLWYRSDSDARELGRSRPLSIAMFVLPLAAMPYYLLRSRPVAERGLAMGVFVGLLLAMPVARWAGVGIRFAIFQAGS
jgi:hypothetical protein